MQLEGVVEVSGSYKPLTISNIVDKTMCPYRMFTQAAIRADIGARTTHHSQNVIIGNSFLDAIQFLVKSHLYFCTGCPRYALLYY